MIDSIYSRFLTLTNDPAAAATLVLAEILSTKSEDPLWLTVNQAAKKLGIGKTKMYELLTAGAVRHTRVGRQIRISPEALQDVATAVEAKPGDPVAALDAFLAR